MNARLPRHLTRSKPSGNIVLTARDRQIIEAVWRYRLLTTDQIQRLTGSQSRTKLNHRLKQLYDHQYLDRPPVQYATFGHADKRPTIHALDKLGASYIEETQGISLPKSVNWRRKNKVIKSADFLEHTIGVAECFLSLQHVIDHVPDLSVTYEPEIIAQSPPRTQKAQFPRSFKTSFEWTDGEYVERSTVADGIFGLIDEARDKRSLCFLEFDRGTEPVVRKTHKLSSIIQKMFGYSDIYERGLHKERFGYASFRVLIVTEKPSRISEMIEAYETHMGHRALKAGGFMFATYEDLQKHSPFGDIWVNGKGERVTLAPSFTLS